MALWSLDDCLWRKCLLSSNLYPSQTNLWGLFHSPSLSLVLLVWWVMKKYSSVLWCDNLLEVRSKSMVFRYLGQKAHFWWRQGRQPVERLTEPFPPCWENSRAGSFFRSCRLYESKLLQFQRSFLPSLAIFLLNLLTCAHRWRLRTKFVDRYRAVDESLHDFINNFKKDSGFWHYIFIDYDNLQFIGLNEKILYWLHTLFLSLQNLFPPPFWQFTVF